MKAGTYNFPPGGSTSSCHDSVPCRSRRKIGTHRQVGWGARHAVVVQILKIVIKHIFPSKNLYKDPKPPTFGYGSKLPCATINSLIHGRLKKSPASLRSTLDQFRAHLRGTLLGPYARLCPMKELPTNPEEELLPALQ